MTTRPCWRCGTTTTVRLYLNGPACPQHTPAALAGKPEPSVPPEQTLEALRARRGIEVGAFGVPVSTVVDDRAVASGKRRSSNHVHQAVKAAEVARRRKRRGEVMTT